MDKTLLDKFPKPLRHLLLGVSCLAAYVTAWRQILPESGQTPFVAAIAVATIAGLVWLWLAKRPASSFDPDPAPKPRFTRFAKIGSLVAAFALFVVLIIHLNSTDSKVVAKSIAPPSNVQANSPINNQGTVNYHNSPGVVNGPVTYDSSEADAKDADDEKAFKDLISHGHIDEARNILTERINALKLSIDSGEQPLAKNKAKYAKLCVRLGETFDVRGEVGDAEACYKKALEVVPNYSTALTNLGGIYLQRSKNDDAEKLFQQVLSAPDADATAKENAMAYLGSMLLERGKLAEAEEIFRGLLNSAMRRNSGFEIAHSYFSLGRIALQRDEFKQARSHFKNAVDMAHKSAGDPGLMSLCYANLARIDFLENDKRAAHENIDKAIKLAKADGRAREEAYATKLQGNRSPHPSLAHRVGCPCLHVSSTYGEWSWVGR